jgi:hypothetical protein
VPNTNKMQWPFPAKDRDPWYETFEQMATAMDSSGYASREDRQIIMGGGGDVTFDAGTNSLTWAESLDFYSLISGFKVSIAATTVAIADGEVIYLNLTRSPTQNISVSTAAANQVPNTDDAMAIAVRVGTVVYWRHGSKIDSGETVNIFGVPGTADQGDTYERSATFGVPNGAFLGESTLGRVMIGGSLIGLSAEVLEAVTGGTITINVKVNAVTKMTAVLSTTDSILKQTISAPGTYPVGVGDQVTVEVVGAGLVTASTLDNGLTVNVALSTGVLLPPGGLPDASASAKGITRLSLDPAIATAPIAVGDNDPRLSESRRVIRTIAQPADGSAFTVSFAPAMPSTDYIVIHTLATVASHFTLSTPEVGKTVNDFTVVTSAAPADGETIYFFVMEI